MLFHVLSEPIDPLADTFRSTGAGGRPLTLAGPGVRRLGLRCGNG
jgi:hypothetical protein